jgi:DNA-binding response OmpR family regulator
MSATILIIEDDPAILRGLKDYFLKRDFQVQTARDGQQGLQAARSGAADLILLDLMLPKMNGYEICRALRAEGRDMPIVMLTAKGQEDDIVRGLEMGADDYVTKPFGIRELHARVLAFLRRAPRGNATTFEFGPCRLDTLSHRLTRAGREIPLTTKEYRLLEFLAQRPGRALTRDMIINGVWGNEVIVTTRSVDRCVTTLRSKIEPDPHEPTYIQTIRDVGYRFEPGGR